MKVSFWEIRPAAGNNFGLGARIMYIAIFDHTNPRPSTARDDAAVLRAMSIVERDISQRNEIRTRQNYEPADQFQSQFPLLILLHSDDASRNACLQIR